ncbi:MAG: hypothetical protein AMXMBFR44_0460 [Candidatus Campbellbacteria bacterium]
MENDTIKKENPLLIPAAIILAAIMISGAWVYNSRYSKNDTSGITKDSVTSAETDLFSGSIALPAVWGNLGLELVRAGVIDGERFKELYEQRGQFTEELGRMMSGEENGQIVITQENAEYLLNLFWALGLANKNPILETGEMMTATGGDASGFASTGGWTMATGNVMDHYSMHRFFDLTPEQQEMVETMSRGIFRPCCGNSAHFPDCNHGMAMLGLLELMASQGATEEYMWDAALAVNTYWFPDTYQTIARYMGSKGVAWESVPPSEILSERFSSGAGFANVKAQITQPQQQRGGGGCSV